jgi:hypothetical protein
MDHTVIRNVQDLFPVAGIGAGGFENWCSAARAAVIVFVPA